MKQSYRVHLIVVAVALITSVAVSSCNTCEAFGSKRIVGNIALVTGDKPADKALIICTDADRCCSTGLNVVPRPNSTTRNVSSAKAKGSWILVEAISKEDTPEYWLIDSNFSINIGVCDSLNCDSLIAAHTAGPYSLSAYKERLVQLGL